MNIINRAAALAAACVAAASVTSAQVFNFLLSGSQETAVAATGSAGFAITELSGSSLSYQIHYTGMASLTGIHFHGPALQGSNASVQIGLSAGPSPISGVAALTPTQVADLLAGQWYLNLHSNAFPAGEIRGQVVSQLNFAPNTILSGSQEVAPVATKGGGAALVTYDPATRLLAWDIAYEGLDSGVTMMHFHGPADANSNAGVRVNIGAMSGSTTISEAFESELLAGLWYINVHTGDVGSGELRGQVNPAIVPEPSTYATLLGVCALALIVRRRCQRSPSSPA